MLLKSYCKTIAFMKTISSDQKGVTAIEYGLITIAMAALIITYFSFSSSTSIVGQLSAGFKKIATGLSTFNAEIPSS